MSVQYTRGIQYTGKISLSTLGDIIEYTGSVQYTRGYHEYTGSVQYTRGYHEYTGGMFSTLAFPCKFNCFPNDLQPHLS